ncbi:hypothetical protein F2Q70_00036968 [Brassica cretica]|uniref:Uncharacterized protein n=1 Tax=Brassica cretica TaxID=69181 RepID=A0A8S9JTB1_BRACR|nr:hypothetical protein F2Q70_00036968 [Brassica cretica]
MISKPNMSLPLTWSHMFHKSNRSLSNNLNVLCGSGEETQGSNGMEDTHEGKVTTTEDMLTTRTPTPILPRLEEKRLK